MYSSWQPDLSADPVEQQVIVEKDAAPHLGVCGKTLTLSSESINVAIDVTDTEKNRCGITVVGFFFYLFKCMVVDNCLKLSLKRFFSCFLLFLNLNLI